MCAWAVAGRDLGASDSVRVVTLGTGVCRDVSGNDTVLQVRRRPQRVAEGGNHARVAQCLSPAGVGARLPVNVSVDGQPFLPGGASVTFDYSPPVLQSVAPAFVEAGGTSTRITLTGRNFGADSSVVFVWVGTQPCTDLVILTPHLRLSCDAPARRRRASLAITVEVAGQGLGASSAAMVPYDFASIPLGLLA